MYCDRRTPVSGRFEEAPIRLLRVHAGRPLRRAERPRNAGRQAFKLSREGLSSHQGNPARNTRFRLAVHTDHGGLFLNGRSLTDCAVRLLIMKQCRRHRCEGFRRARRRPEWTMERQGRASSGAEDSSSRRLQILQDVCGGSHPKLHDVSAGLAEALGRDATFERALQMRHIFGHRERVLVVGEREQSARRQARQQHVEIARRRCARRKRSDRGAPGQPGSAGEIEDRLIPRRQVRGERTRTPLWRDVSVLGQVSVVGLGPIIIEILTSVLRLGPIRPLKELAAHTHKARRRWMVRPTEKEPMARLCRAVSPH